jgi:hypothetical protein
MNPAFLAAATRPYPAAFAVLVPSLAESSFPWIAFGGMTVLGGAFAARFVDLHGRVRSGRRGVEQ